MAHVASRRQRLLPSRHALSLLIPVVGIIIGIWAGIYLGQVQVCLASGIGIGLILGAGFTRDRHA